MARVFFFIFHALSLELSFFFERRFPLKASILPCPCYCLSEHWRRLLSPVLINTNNECKKQNERCGLFDCFH